MKKSLIDELKRIHTLTYGEQLQEGFIDSILSGLGLKKRDDPKKADFVTGDINSFYNDLETIKQNGGLSQQAHGSMQYQKGVETMQIGLTLLGYSLPQFGIDGLYGPETQEAVSKFKMDNDIQSEDQNATPEVIDGLISQLKNKNITSEMLKQEIDPVISNTEVGTGNVNKDKIKYAIDYLMKNGRYTAAQAAGIVGNLQVESGLNPNIEGDKTLSIPSVGIAQWREDRLVNLKRFASQNGTSWNDLNTQLSFILYELKTNYNEVDSLIRKSNNPVKIAQIVQSKYEISTPDSLKQRQILANQFYNDYSGGNIT